MKEPLRPKRETFVVRVLCRQNNTWQGEMLWAEQNERMYFRSALELMELMGSALEENRTETIRRSWGSKQGPESGEEPAVPGN